MKYFDWYNDKNKWLTANRGISFEFIIECIKQGDLIYIADNHHPYEHQKVYMVKVDEFIYEVPYVEDDSKIFLKTIYPSRKSTDKYLSDN